MCSEFNGVPFKMPEKANSTGIQPRTKLAEKIKILRDLDVGRQ